MDAQTEAATAIIEENFDAAFPPAGWQTVTPTGEPWQQSSLWAVSGMSAFHNDAPGAQDAWLVTPSFAPTVNTVLRFMQNQNFGSFYTYHGLYLSAGSANPLDGEFVELAELGPGTENIWEQIEKDLSSYAGQVVTLAFVYRGNFDDEWYIDDLFVGDVTTVYGPDTQILAKTTGRRRPHGQRHHHPWPHAFWVDQSGLGLLRPLRAGHGG